MVIVIAICFGSNNPERGWDLLGCTTKDLAHRPQFYHSWLKPAGHKNV